MNRLQVGGFALIINARCESNVGRVVLLEAYMGDMEYTKDAWRVSSREVMENVLGRPESYGHISAKNLMPLGDDKGIELYNLKEELVEEQSQ